MPWALAMLSLLLAMAGPATSQTVAEVREPGDQRLWVFEKDGQEFGHCWSRYEGPRMLGTTPAHSFWEQVELRQPTGPGEELAQRMTMRLLTDDRGHPLSFEFTTAMGDAQATIQVTVAEAQGVARITQGTIARELTVPVPADALLLANNFISHLELALALNLEDPGTPPSLTLFSANLLRPLPFTLQRLRDAEDGTGVWLKDNLNEEILWQDGRLMRLTLVGQDTGIRQVERPHEPFQLPPRDLPDRPRMEAEEVTIGYGDVSLSGTLTRPPGVTGRLPAVFFISGSGGQDRDGFAGGLPVGTYQLLDHLTMAGFQVLRVDDRGVGRSKGPTEGMSYRSLVDDARACVEFLRHHPGTDPDRVALIGHSEGGITAPLLAAEMPDLAAIVLMAAPGRALGELLEEQIEASAERDATDARRKELREVTREALRRVRDGEPLADLEVPPVLRGILSAEQWLKDHMAVDPLGNLRKVHCPVLILQGARDVQVSAERDAPLLAQALEEAGHPDFTLVVFPDLDHLFKRTDGSHSVSMDYLTDRPVDAGFLATMTDWLLARLASE